LFEAEFLNSKDGKSLYRELLRRVVELVASAAPEGPYSGKNTQALKKILNAQFLPEKEASQDELVAQLRQAIQNSIQVAHPYTIAHLHCPPLISALAAEVVISALNQSMDSFDQAPFATILEQKLIAWLCAEVGFPETADGTFTAGGTQSNYQALLLARDAFARSRWNWSVQESGLPAEWQQMRVLCSEVAHFTVEKSMSQLGMGTDSVVRVPVDENFRLRPDALQDSLTKMRNDGLLPFAIVATAGTTDFGSIDSLPEIAALARSSRAWLHVDAAYGGALLFSLAHRNKLRGVEAADSVGIDFHKLLWQPIPCSTLLVRERRHFESMRLHAEYLNPEAHEQQGIPDLVTSSLLTSRRFDALKLAISLQALGREKLSAMIDRTIELAKYAALVIAGNARFELMHQPELSTVVFRYVPANSGLHTDDLNAQLRQLLFDHGVAILGYTRVNGRQCLKLTCMNPTTTDVQLEELVRRIAEQGKQLEEARQKTPRSQPASQ
jgi:L-2,4-diaminobutyrate decarboxylase